MKNVMMLLDTDKHPTPFDILAAYDSGFDAVVPYEGVEPEDVPRIVQDAIFSRGVKGVAYTKIFISGSDVEKSEAILEAVRKAMVPPFEVAVIVDPRGGHTTASAMIAKVEEALSDKGFGTLEGKHVAIPAGTGQVGQLVAKICLMLGAKVTITSRRREKAEEIARNIAKEVVKVNEKGEKIEATERIKGLQGATPEEIYDAVKDADVILATAAAGVKILPMEILSKLRNCKVVADVNAVPPSGIEGLSVKDDKREILPGVYSIGALPIGALKNKIEARVLMEARKAKKGIFDYRFAFEKAKQLLERKRGTMEVLELEKIEGKKLTVVFLQRLENPSESELEYVKKLLMDYKPDFVAEELGDRRIEDFYEKDPYVRIVQDMGIMGYPVDISEYAKLSISSMVDEKKRLADRVEATYKELEKLSRKEDAEYVKAYAEALEAEYKELKEHAEVTVRNSWMVKGILDVSREIEGEELKCLFIGGISHWRGTMELLKTMGVEVRESNLFASGIGT
jgi:methylene-tetrahydromethanopterin dehydrogenase